MNNYIDINYIAIVGLLLFIIGLSGAQIKKNFLLVMLNLDISYLGLMFIFTYINKLNSNITNDYLLIILTIIITIQVAATCSVAIFAIKNYGYLNNYRIKKSLDEN